MKGRSEEGYVLAAALAALLAMSIVAAALVSAAVGELRRVAAAERAAADDAALESAIILAAAELVEEPRQRDLAFAGGEERVTIGGQAITLRVRWESEKLDLNAAGLEAIEARLAAAGLAGADRETIRRRLEAKRAAGEPVRLVDDVLTGLADPECARGALTVFGGRTDWTEAADGETMPIGRPAPGSRITVHAAAEGGAARGREAVLLVTGDPRAPVRIMDVRATLGRDGEGCRGP